MIIDRRRDVERPHRMESLPAIVAIILLTRISTIYGECTFPEAWEGRWFQSGVQNALHINSTHIETKGECYEELDDTKFLVYDKTDNCYRCMAIHSKHVAVLQYKETYCEANVNDLCFGISGDASLYSMFRKYPEAKPIACPFKGPPFTFSYNRGSGDCTNPPSKAESCTDDSRLVLKYQSCPDVVSTESNVEELVCLATWKEGSTRYLLSRILQVNRRALTSDEDQYRCFIYQRKIEGSETVYYMAQSADASCNGVQSSTEGSKTMRFVTVDNHHNRCRFPIWITEHHTWLSLDRKKVFKFSTKNATLNIRDEETKPNANRFQHQNYVPFGFEQNGFESQDQRRQNSEMRMVCHNITQSQEHKKVQIIAHVTAGCNSGYVCMMFFKRDNNIIEFQQSERYVDSPEEACRYFDPTTIPFTTLVTHALHPKKCPHRGRFTLLSDFPFIKATGTIRKRRQQPGLESATGGVNGNDGHSVPDGINNSGTSASNCHQRDYDGFSVGCNGNHELMQFRSTACTKQSLNPYTCLGSWQENNTFYVITSLATRTTSDAPRYCFIYEISNGPPKNSGGGVILDQRNPEGRGGGGVGISGGGGNSGGVSKPFVLRLSSVSETCNRDIIPGVTGSWALNFTSNGTCTEVGSTDFGPVLTPSLLLILAAVCLSSALLTR